MKAIHKSAKTNAENLKDWVNSQNMSSDYNFAVRKAEKFSNWVKNKIAKRKLRENLANVRFTNIDKPRSNDKSNHINSLNSYFVNSPIFIPKRPSVKKYKRLMSKKRICHVQ